MRIDFDFKEVPTDYRLCFNADCPRREGCLRWVAGLKVPASLPCGPAVYPTALGADGQCRFYQKAEPQRMAWGFSKLFHNVLARHVQGLRLGLVQYLGSKTAYYRYNRGDRLLTPVQQAWIIDYFRKAGYAEEIGFDGYATTYDFR